MVPFGSEKNSQLIFVPCQLSSTLFPLPKQLSPKSSANHWQSSRFQFLHKLQKQPSPWVRSTDSETEPSRSEVDGRDAAGCTGKQLSTKNSKNQQKQTLKLHKLSSIHFLNTPTSTCGKCQTKSYGSYVPKKVCTQLSVKSEKWKSCEISYFQERKWWRLRIWQCVIIEKLLYLSWSG